MDLHTLKRAASVQGNLERAERNLEAMAGHEIQGISIHHTARSGESTIDLCKGRAGTGTITGIGFPDGLKAVLNAAMHEYFRSQVKAYQDELANLGIETAA